MDAFSEIWDLCQRMHVAINGRGSTLVLIGMEPNISITVLHNNGELREDIVTDQNTALGAVKACLLVLRPQVEELRDSTQQQKMSLGGRLIELESLLK